VAEWAFDRAADYYDATRALPAAVLDEVVDLLVGELAASRNALEVGVGTGRIALPLHERGVPLVGIDLALPMMDKLVANAGGRPFSLVLGDATALPFGDGTFDAVVASHVFHLVPHWQAAVGEAMRVLAVGGTLLVDFGGGEPAPWHEGARRVMAEVGVHHVRPGVSSADQVRDFLGDGVARRALKRVVMPVRRSLAQDLEQWEAQLHSWTWQYSRERIHEACDAVRRWAAAEGMAFDDTARLERVIQWWAFDKRA